MNDTINITIVKSGRIFLFLLLFLTGSLSAQLPTGFIDAKLQSGYVSPMGVIFSKNGQKMFVWEKAGKLWCSTWNGAMYVKQATPTLDLSEEVADWRDFGLQSVALDPNFDTNGLIYLFYQVDRHYLMNFGTPQYDPIKNEYFAASISRLTRYKVTTANGVATVDNTTRKVLLGETKSTGVPMIYESHAGGQIIFGADGTLLVTTGDNASFVSHDLGNDSDTYWQQAINDGILRSTENVGSLRAQQINSFCGKMLRLDPNTGDAVASNPYYDAANPRSAKSRVWALGFRNPYRMTFKTGTGETNPANGNPGTFIVGDVQDGTWEELHMIEKGGVNCGWPLYEGIEPYYVFYNSGKTDPEEVGNPTFVSNCARGGRGNINNPVPSQRRFSHAAPFLDYHHLQNTARTVDYTRGNTEAASALGSVGSIAAGTGFKGNCVTAGTYYTGTKFPPNYRNVFFFADYGNNWIKAASLHDNETHQLHEVLDFADTGYGKGIVDVEYCPLDESLVYININTGDIQKISFGEGNRPPKAVATADKTSGASPLTVNFSSTGTNHPDGKPLSYKWDFGDGTNSTSANPTHIFTSTGSRGFTVVLTVTDTSGLTDVANLSISTNNTVPSVKISNPADNSLYTLIGASLVTLESAITDNDTTGMQYAWQVTLRHNNHEHREPINNLKNPVAQISPVGCDGETYYYFISLTVTDNGGLTATDSVKIYPDCSSGNLSVSNLTATPQVAVVDVAWANPVILFDEVMVVAKAGSGFLTNPSGTTFTADTSFTGVGSVYEGGKVVYRGTGANVSVTSLTAGTTYFFRVFTRLGTTWTGGVETSAVPTAPVPVPINLKATAQTNAVAVTWSNPVLAFDEVMIVAQPSGSISIMPSGTTYTANANFTGNGTIFQNGKVVYRGTGTSVTVTSLTADVPYYFRIFTRQGTNWTTNLEVTATPTAPQPPPSPTNLMAMPQVNAINVMWTNPTVTFDEVMVVAQLNNGFTTTPSGIGYIVDANFTGAGTAFETGKVVYRGSGSNVIVTNLTANETYFFRVYTRLGALWSSGVEASGVPTAPQPVSPTNVVATAQVNAVALTWTNPTTTFDDIMVVAQATNSITTAPSGTTYTADASFIGAGTAFQAGKVVYRGTGTGMTVINLTAGTTYFFRVFTRKGSLWSGGTQVSAVPTAPPVVQPVSPTNVVATAQVNAVALTWTNPTIAFDDIMVVAQATNSITIAPSGTSYTADASFTGAGTAFQAGKVVYRGTGTGMTVTNLTAGTTYFFRVFTRSGTLWSGGSQVSSVPTAPPVVQPVSPTNVVATAQVNAVALTWTNPTIAFDDIMVVAQATNSITTAPSGTSYTADASFTGAGTAFQAGKVVYRGTGTGMTVTNLTGGTTYFFRVFTRLGTLWSGGTQVSAVPTAPLVAPAPTNLRLTSQTSAVAVTWTNPTVTFDEVMVTVKANAGFTTLPTGTSQTANSIFTGTATIFEGGKVAYRGTGTSATVTGLTAPTNYFFRVYVRRGTVWYNGVEASAAPIAPIPPVPTSLVATAQTNAVAVTWVNSTLSFDEVMVVAKAGSGFSTLPSGIAYTTDASFTGLGSSFESGKVTYRGTGTSVTVTNLTAGTTYFFRVYVRKGSTWYSGVEASAVPTALAPPTPTNLKATAQTNAVAVTWTSPTAAYDEVMVVAKSGSGFTTLPSGTTFTANTSFTDANSTVFAGGKVTYRGTGTSVTVTNLTAGTTYFFRVYVRKGTTWYNGVEASAIPTVPPVPTPTNLKATAQAQAVAVTWTSPSLSYDEVMVVAKASSGFTTLPSGTSFTANTDFTNASSTTVSGGKVVYRGTSTSVTVTNLTAGTTYFFRVYVRKGTVWYNGLEASAVPTTSVTQLGCLKGTYFNNTSLSGNPLSIRAESSINYSWGTGSPFSGVNSDNFSVRWDGTVFAPVAGTYTFAVTANDGVRLWVNNVLIVDKWSDQSSAKTYTATVTLKQGQNVPIKMEYYEKTGSSTAKLFWTVPTKSSVTVPFSACPLPQFGCLKGSYFNNATLTGIATTVRAESCINYNWSSSPLSGISSDNFSVRWEGTVFPPSTGTYTFSITVDDGARLWVNNVLIIDKWVDQNPTTYTTTVNLTQGQTVPIKMEYYDRTGSASAKLCWIIPSQTNQVIDFLPCSTSTFDATKCYKLTEQNNSRVLVIPNSSTTNGTQLQTTSSYSGTKTQLWRIKDLGDGTQRLVNTNSGKSMTVLNSSTSNSAAIVQWDWQSGTNQRWTFSKNLSGYYQIVAKNSGKAMEATSSNSNSVVQNSVSTSKSQQFKVETATCPSGALTWESANILSANGYRDGKKAVITWVSNANDNTDYFMVQKLNNDQQIFEKLASVNAQQGNVGETKFYSVDDIEPTDGDNLYRVALYRNGQDIPQYSEIIALDFSFLNDYMLFPNPANDYVDIDLDRVRYKYVEIDLMDAAGKVVRQQKIESAPVAPFRMSLEGLPVGTYFVRIDAEGKRAVVKKLVIAR